MTKLRDAVRQPWVVMPVAGALIIAGWFTFGPGHAKSSASTNTTTNERLVTATAGTLADTVSAQGTVAAAQTDDLNFASAGTVTAVNVTAGQKVTKGQVLATIDSAALVSAFEDAQANEASAAASLSDDESAGASSAQIDADTTRLTSEQDALATAYANLGNAQLVASFDGTVASVNLTVGQQLSSSGSGATSSTGAFSGRTAADLGSSQSQGNGSGASTAQIEVVSAGSYTVSLGVDATDVKSLAVGQSASITLTTATNANRFGRFPGGGAGLAGGFFGGGAGGTDNTPTGGNGTTTTGNGTPTNTGQAIAGTASATGTVTSVATVADASSGVTSYPVTVTFTDTSGDYNAGATVDVDVTISQEKNVVLIPTFAVTSTNGASTVVVRTNGKDETRTVTTGRTSGAEIAITSGLQAGEQVVISFPSAGAGGFGGGQGRPGQGAGG